jgi:hypothetical protein
MDSAPVPTPKLKKTAKRHTRRAPKVAPPSAVCFMSVEPHPTLITFAERLAAHHRVYIVIDSNECQLPVSNYITFIRLQDDFCRGRGFIHSNPAFHKTPTAWDKALLYFSTIELAHRHVWFIEEDVFIPTETILKTISAKYPTTDLLVSEHNNRRVNHSWSWWPVADGFFSEPMFHAMVCAVRMSRTLLQAIAAFAKEKQRLVFIEILFNTLAHQKGLRIETPIEMQYIVHRHDWDETKLSPNTLVHPIKDLLLHDTYRAHILEHNLR